MKDDLQTTYLTIPKEYRKDAHPGAPERDGFPREPWTRFRAALDRLATLEEVKAQIDPDKGFQIRHDPERLFIDLDWHSFALDRAEARPWIFETHQLTPLIGCIQLIARLTLPGVRLTSVREWSSPEWLAARALYAKAFGRILWKSPLTIR